MEKTWTTADLRAATSYSASMLVELEKRGVIRKTAKNRWPMPQTLDNIVRDLRARLQSGMSDSEAKLRATKQRMLELRLAKEMRQVIDLDESLSACTEIVGTILSELDCLPAMVAGRGENELRQKIDEGITVIRNRAAQKLTQKSEEMRTGKVETNGEADDQ